MLDKYHDRSWKSPRQRKQVIFLVILILILGYIMAKEYQTLLKSFATNRHEVMKSYLIANNIPTQIKITTIKNI